MRKSTKFTLPMLLSTPLVLSRPCLGPHIPFQTPSGVLVNPVCLISRLPKMVVDIAYCYYYSFSPSVSDLFDLLRAFSIPSGVYHPPPVFFHPPPVFIDSFLSSYCKSTVFYRTPAPIIVYYFPYITCLLYLLFLIKHVRTSG